MHIAPNLQAYPLAMHTAQASLGRVSRILVGGVA